MGSAASRDDGVAGRGAQVERVGRAGIWALSSGVSSVCSRGSYLAASGCTRMTVVMAVETAKVIPNDDGYRTWLMETAGSQSSPSRSSEAEFVGRHVGSGVDGAGISREQDSAT